VSHASAHPVRCARQADLGCPAQVPGSRHDQIRAQAAGWFFSRREDAAFCPDHVPDWVPAWRERQKAARPDGSRRGEPYALG
jgi:hypothetical protein